MELWRSREGCRILFFCSVRDAAGTHQNMYDLSRSWGSLGQCVGTAGELTRDSPVVSGKEQDQQVSVRKDGANLASLA